MLASSISARREALYKARGLDIERWIDIVGERKALRAEIGRIAQDYEGDEDGEGEIDLQGEDTESESESSSEGDTMDESKGGVEELSDALLVGSRKNGNGKRKVNAINGKRTQGLDYEDVDSDEQKGKRAARKENDKGH